MLTMMQLGVSFAQISVYKPFPSKMVKVAITVYDPTSNIQVAKFYRTEISGDTILNGIKYSKIYAIDTSIRFWGGIRNDVPNKKVYQYKASTGKEKLLYDFNLTVGDTVFKDAGYGFYDILGNAAETDIGSTWSEYIDTAWVSDIDSVLMNYDGLYHKRFNFSARFKPMGMTEPHALVTNGVGCYPSTSACHIKLAISSLVEGAGQVSNPVNYVSQELSFNWRIGPSCVSFNSIEEKYNPSPGECKSFLTNISDEQEQFGAIVYPNPSTGKFHLIFKGEKADEVEIVDLLGRCIYKSPIKNVSEIDVSEMVIGIYFLKLSFKNGHAVIKRIVKK